MVDTSITPPARLDPPYKEPMLDAGGLVTQLWRDWFTGVSLALFGFAPGGGGGVIMQTGTGTSDIAAGVTVTLPTPYTARTLDFQCDGGTLEPHAYFNSGTIVSLPLDVVTGTLNKIDPSSGSVVAVANTDFTWFATGV